MKLLLARLKVFSKHPVAKGFLLVASGSTIANVFAYFYHVVVGRILGPVAYGELAALLALFFILNVPALTIQTVLTKAFSTLKARGEIAKAGYLLRESLKVLTVAGGIGLLAILPFVGAISNYLHISQSVYILWLYIILFLFLLSVAGMSAIGGFQMFLASSILATVGMFLRLIFGIVTAFFGVGWVLIGNIASNILSFIALVFPLKFLIAVKSKKFPLSSVLTKGYSVSAFLTLLSLTSLYSTDVLLVKHYFTPYEAGIYASLSVLGKIIFFATSSIGYVLFPSVAERSEKNVKSRRLGLYSLAAVGGMSLLIELLYVLFPTFITRLLFGASFLGASPYLGLFGAFLVFVAMSNLISTLLLAEGKTKVAIFTVLGALTQIILISFYHPTLRSVILLEIVIAGLLFVSLVTYYMYENR